MASYLLQFSYSQSAWAALIKNPQNRREAVQKMAGQLGGTVAGCWMAFGEYDVVAIVEGPDNINAAACSMAVTASGAFRAVKTTPLLTMEDGFAAMQKASKLTYAPPTAAS